MEYLDVACETVGMQIIVTQIYYEKNNRDLWELYLSVHPDKSFNDWKTEIIERTNPVYAKGGTKNEKETQAIIKKSEDILKGFIPKDE